MAEKPLNPECTDARHHHRRPHTYVAATAPGTHFGDAARGFFWLVTDALDRLGVVAAYSGVTLLVVGRIRSLVPDGVGLGGPPRLCHGTGTSFHCHRRGVHRRTRIRTPPY